MSIAIADYDDYKAFIRDLVASMPKKGRGIYRKLSQHLRVSTVLVSQVFGGDRDLSLEQAYATAEFFSLRRFDLEIFLALVQRERAGTADLKDHFESKLKGLREAARSLKAKLVPAQEFKEETKAIFYSDWFYSAARIASAIPGCQTPEALARKLGLDVSTMKRVIEFLLAHGLCVEEDGKIKYGPSSTFVTRGAPLYASHHRNWRLKSIEMVEVNRKTDLFYTTVVALSKVDFEALRKQWLEHISKFSKATAESPSETVACLALDWFEV